MKKIICPTDFSDTAQNAIAYAAKLAQDSGAELVLLNVQSLFETTPKEVVFGDSHTIEKASYRLEMLSREVARTFKISCYSEVQPAIAPLANTIGESAVNTDLIVMGTNGADDLFQFFMGSNTYNVARKAAIPLLLIPDGCMYGKIEQVIYAFDYLHERRLPLTQLRPWVEEMHSKLSILQVVEKESKAEQPELQALQAAFGNTNPTLSIKYEKILSSETAHSIHHHMMQTDANVLALCTTHHNLIEKLFHKSVIKTIAAIASYPVFIFHH